MNPDRDKREGAFLRTLYRPVNEKMGLFRTKMEADGVPLIRIETENMLRLLLRQAAPGTILEIGTACGYSACLMAELLPDARIITIESEEQAFGLAKQHIAAAGFSDRIRVLNCDGQTGCERLYEEGLRDVQFLFLDGAKSHYRRFLESACGLLAEGAMIVSDDILLHGMTEMDDAALPAKHRRNVSAMRAYIGTLTKDPRLDTIFLPDGNGMAVTVYHRPEDK